jgi:hypothetical protein
MRVFLDLLLSALLGFTEARTNKKYRFKYEEGDAPVVSMAVDHPGDGDRELTSLDPPGDGGLDYRECNSDTYDAGGQGQTDCENWPIESYVRNYGV